MTARWRLVFRRLDQLAVEHEFAETQVADGPADAAGAGIFGGLVADETELRADEWLVEAVRVSDAVGAQVRAIFPDALDRLPDLQDGIPYPRLGMGSDLR